MKTNKRVKPKVRTGKRSAGSLNGVVMRWARMEMAVRMASVGGTDGGDGMSDDAETAKLEVLQAALPGKWRQWKKAIEAHNKG